MTPLIKNSIMLFQICLLLFFMSDTINAQCMADAGEDTTICSNLWGLEVTVIGGNPSASNGVAPYQYAWEINYYDILGTLRTASFFLNDTTLANPSVVADISTLDELTLKLTVTDAAGNICVDSMSFDFSVFIYQITDHFAYINPGDSVYLLSSVGSDHHLPLSYSWQPSHSLSNPNIENPIAFPDTTTFYTVIVTDAAGCTTQDPDLVEIYVNTTSVNNVSEGNSSFELYPNPTRGEVNIEFDMFRNEPVYLFLYDYVGKEISVKEITRNKTTISIAPLKNCPIVFYQLVNEKGETIGSGKILSQN